MPNKPKIIAEKGGESLKRAMPIPFGTVESSHLAGWIQEMAFEVKSPRKQMENVVFERNPLRSMKKCMKRMPSQVAFTLMLVISAFGPAAQIVAGPRVTRIEGISVKGSDIRPVVSEILVTSPISPVRAPNPKMQELAAFISEIPENPEITTVDSGARYGNLLIENFAPPAEANKANAEVQTTLLLRGANGVDDEVGSIWARVNDAVGTIDSNITMVQDGIKSTLSTTLYMENGYLYMAGHLTKFDVADPYLPPLYEGSGGWRSRDGVSWERIAIGNTVAAASDFYDQADDMVGDVSDCPAYAAVACAAAVAVGVAVVVIIIVVCYLFCWILWYVDATPRRNIREELRREMGLPWDNLRGMFYEGGVTC